MKLLKVAAVVGKVDEPGDDPVDAYIKSFEWGPENRGIAELTVEYWRQDRGLRPDGRPNRPLTAFTCEIVDLDGEL